VRTGAALDHIYAIDPAYSAAHLLEAALQDGLNPATVSPLHSTPHTPDHGVARYQVHARTKARIGLNQSG
jgi:hypothetical protein